MVVVIALFFFWLAINGRFAAYAKLVTTRGTDNYGAAFTAILSQIGTGLRGALPSIVPPGYGQQGVQPGNTVPGQGPGSGPAQIPPGSPAFGGT